jgi:preprotein translocase subunit SecF
MLKISNILTSKLEQACSKSLSIRGLLAKSLNTDSLVLTSLTSFGLRYASSSGRGLPTPEEAKAASERIHGSIDPTLVRSKAMRAKLLKNSTSSSKTSTEATSEDKKEETNTDQTSKELLSQRDQEQQQHYQQQQEYQQPTFSQIMFSNMISGFGMALGFILIGVIFRMLFGGKLFINTTSNITSTTARTTTSYSSITTLFISTY